MRRRRQTNVPRAPAKIFQCKGYDNCSMTFTRSEHLARHVRKHTGEKPFQCIIPRCGKMFSRFDNMMQHTQTHLKDKDKASSRASSSRKVDSEPMVNNANSPIEMQQAQERNSSSAPEPIDMNPMPSSSSSMLDSRLLPYPTRRASVPSYTPVNLPSLRHGFYYPYDTPYYPREISPWPMRSNSYPTHEAPSNPLYNEEVNETRRSSLSTASSDASLISPTNANFPLFEGSRREGGHRRISIQDLNAPIEHLRNIPSEQGTPRADNGNTIAVTDSEFEAMTVLSQLRRFPWTKDSKN